MCRHALIPLLCLTATACADRGADAGAGALVTGADAALIAQDPVIARALHDPLMSDPDLAARNEANAALGWADSSALPVFAATPEAARAARAALRLELLEGGAIPALPPAQKTAPRQQSGPLASAADLLAAAGAPAACANRLKQDFALAANLPPPAAIPQQAMVMQAGGADTAGCGLRIIRYASPAAPEDVLQYHYARALRAGLAPQYHAMPDPMISASGARGGEALVVHVRLGAGGLTRVDLVYRAPATVAARDADRP